MDSGFEVQGNILAVLMESDGLGWEEAVRVQGE